MILISSAAYVEREFQLEFGALPPALLPVGNKRLFEFQIKALKESFNNEKIVLSLPKSYVLNFRDKKILKSYDVDVVYNEEGLSLGESIAAVICNYLETIKGLRLLHGDTLVNGFVDDLDCIGVSEAKDDHHWQVDDECGSIEMVWCGYFSFSLAHDFLACIMSAKGDFVKSIRNYDSKRSFQRFEPKTWHDFGHISTYFQSRSKITTERYFNSLSLRGGSLVKTGSPYKKIKAEYNWLRKIDEDLLVYTPQLTRNSLRHDETCSYQIEYLPLPPLNEIFVHGLNSPRFWNKIFSLCDSFFIVCENTKVDFQQTQKTEKSAKLLIEEKTVERLNEYALSSEYSDFDLVNVLNGQILPSINSIVGDCINRLSKNEMIFGISHGDFCLSNVLFDSRTQRIKVIDPRGLDYFGDESIYGDLQYDIAKLSHSIIGLYDHIVAGSFELDVDFAKDKVKFIFEIHKDRNVESIQEAFKERVFINKISYKDVMPLTVLLFLSMLPLHNDQPIRQKAFIANALRLYSDMILMER